MGNFCFPINVQLKDYVIDDERLHPEGELTLYFSEEFDCYMMRFDLKNFEKYYFRLWPEGQQFPYVSSSDSDSDSGVDVPDL